MTAASEIYSVLLALLFAVAAGLVGSVALMKRMLLAGDVISHVALPGLGLAFLFNFNPLVGGGATLFLGTLLIWQLQKKTGFATEGIIGVIFAVAVAVGVTLTPKKHMMGALFGKFRPLSPEVFVIGAACVLAIIVFLFWARDQLTLSLFSPELASATGVKLDRLNLYFLLSFSLTVLVGLRFMGGLLAGSLIILPAATGRRLGSNMSRFLLFSAIASVAAVGMGYALNHFVLHAKRLGPIIVITSGVIFALSLLISPNREKQKLTAD
jgi:ABC-type Mn2+/Zn2+ transport system permease subunit